ncbi:MAG: hypothetical protein PHW02_05715 [bacterium]|nr:hypothetical protein [bacterium]
MTKIEFFLLFSCAALSVSPESFGDIASNLSIYEDSVQMKRDSVLAWEYREESIEIFPHWLKSPDWTKRAIGVRVLSKIDDKSGLEKILNESKIDVSYSFRIFDGDSDDFFTAYDRPLRGWQYASFISMASKRGWKSDFADIIGIAESKDASDYIVVRALDAAYYMLLSDSTLSEKLNERFFNLMYKKSNSLIDDKLVALLSQTKNISAESLFSYKKNIRGKINLVKYYSFEKDTAKIFAVESLFKSYPVNQNHMLEFETKNYLKTLSEAQIEAVKCDTSLKIINKLLESMEEEIYGE